MWAVSTWLEIPTVKQGCGTQNPLSCPSSGGVLIWPSGGFPCLCCLASNVQVTLRPDLIQQSLWLLMWLRNTLLAAWPQVPRSWGQQAVPGTVLWPWQRCESSWTPVRPSAWQIWLLSLPTYSVGQSSTWSDQSQGAESTLLEETAELQDKGWGWGWW